MRVSLNKFLDSTVSANVFELEDSLIPEPYFFLRVDQLLVVFLLLVVLHIQQ